MMENRNTRIYISGKMTGEDVEVYRENFARAEQFLRDTFGFEVINPCKFEEPKGKKWEDYILRDLDMIRQSDGVYMLKDWVQSNGARTEFYFARGCGKKIMFEVMYN